MTTYNTQNPLGSSDPRDLYDNAENLDNFVNGEQPAYDDRLGKSRKSWAGMESDFQDEQTRRESEFDAAQDDREGVFNAYLVSAGYQFAGDYAAGIEITQYNQVVRDSNGEFWRVSGSNALPYTTTGAGLPEGGAFVAVGDAALRQELALPVSGGNGALHVSGAVIYADTIADLQALDTSELVDGQQAAIGDASYIYSAAAQRWIVDPGVSVTNGYVAWEPPLMESMDPSDPEHIYDGTSVAYVSMLIPLWDQLITPGYVTKETLGPDSSGNTGYNVYRYVFEPESYDSTIIISANMHGGEKTAMYALWFFLREVVNNWHSHPQLAYLRKNVRLVVLPVANPTGFRNHSRQNANGVDINRNFDYRWDEAPVGAPWDADYKGPSPFSEVEAQYIRDTLMEFSDAVAYLDLHNFSPSGNSQAYPYYMPAENADGSNVIDKVVSALVRDGEFAESHRSYGSTGFNYAANEYNMYALNPEFDPGLYGDRYSAEALTETCRYHGNLIMAFALEKYPPLMVSRLSGFAEYHWLARANGELTISTGPELELVNNMTVSLSMRGTGYIKMTGHVVVAGTEAAQVVICPRRGQNGQGKFGASATSNYYDDSFKRPEEEVYASIADESSRVVIPFMTVFPVMPGGGQVATAAVGLYARATAGTVSILKYQAMVEFVPSNRADGRVTQRWAPGSGMVRRVPTP